MFTGIVEEIGTVKAIRQTGSEGKIIIGCRKVIGREGSLGNSGRNTLERPTEIGDSICVNGVCLTVTAVDGGSFTADVMPETLRRSSLGDLRPGSPVDLERAMPANGRFGGHIVSGHIDGTGRIDDIRRENNAVWYRIECGPELMRYIVEKGSIAVDGISLTVADVDDRSFSISVIPHTIDETVLSRMKRGDKVNLENDIIAKYVEKLTLIGNDNRRQ